MNRAYAYIVASLFISLTSASTTICQTSELKDEAQLAFQAEDYSAAIFLLEKVIAEDPSDAEAYYYLGFFTHYLAHDSIPLVGYSLDHSDRVLEYLRKAVSLDPSLGNAFYFIGAEYGARFGEALMRGDISGMHTALVEGRQEGGYPDWMIEFGRNMLGSCEPNAILFTGGDLDANTAWYLQYVEGFRRDVTVIPLWYLDRPWFLMILSEGNSEVYPSAAFEWTQDQIQSMRPYKWKANTYQIPINDDARALYQLPSSMTHFEWIIEPDLHDDNRSYLSSRYAALTEILRANRWTRPICVSMAGHSKVPTALQDRFEIRGFVLQLLPVESTGKPILLNVRKTEEFVLEHNNFTDIGDSVSKDYSRVSGVLQNYRVIYLSLLRHYQAEGQIDKMRAVLEAMERNLPDSVLPLSPALAETVAEMRKEAGLPPRL